MNTVTAPRAVLFDLDGTLADTAPDLAAALNRTLLHYGHAPMDYARIRPVVSHGGMALIRLGFAMAPDAPGFEERRQYLLDAYADNLCEQTRLFDGMPTVLDTLDRRGIHWGVVTNKPGWLTGPLVGAMGLDGRAACVVSGDTCAQRKPHPQPILHACELVGSTPADTWYVGDAGRDMLAGRAAGCITVAAMYGYLHPDDPPDTWEADLRIDRPGQLIKLVDGDDGT